MKFVVAITLILFGCVSKKNEQQAVVTSDTKRPTTEKYHPTYTEDLEDSLRTLDLSYVAWACQCANWVLASDHEKYQESGGISQRSIFIEAADSTLELPDTIGYTGDVIRIDGRFYTDKGYPRNYPVTEMTPEKARVFRYTKYKMLNSGYVHFKER
jgi:hypothetical protein